MINPPACNPDLPVLAPLYSYDSCHCDPRIDGVPVECGGVDGLKRVRELEGVDGRQGTGLTVSTSSSSACNRLFSSMRHERTRESERVR